MLKRPARHLRLRHFAQRIGRRGEQAAAEYLANAGYDLLCRNYRAPHGVGELDLILRDPAGVICIVEVKTRREKHAQQLRPAWAVDESKQQKIRRAAKAYAQALPNCEATLRFDVVEVWCSKNGIPKRLRHWPGAFGWKRRNPAKIPEEIT
ncbi:MAG: YraN family protein [Victivallales bacterium]|nr:YraN family protein [Victivallales bacterium]